MIVSLEVKSVVRFITHPI